MIIWKSIANHCINHIQILNPSIGKFELSEDEFDAFVTNAEEEIEIDETQLESNTDFYRLLLKALIARNLYDNNAYFEVLWTSDKEINKALDVVNEKLVYESFWQVLEQ